MDRRLVPTFGLVPPAAREDISVSGVGALRVKRPPGFARRTIRSGVYGWVVVP